jgi:hypothetical protein
MNNFIPIVEANMTSYKLRVTQEKTVEILDLLNKYIETLIFNIVSIAAIITMINNSNTIKSQTIKLVKSYINDKCKITSSKKISGGTVLPSEYFGHDSGSYSEANISNDILNVDFASGLLRPAIGGGGRGKRIDIYECINNKINELLEYYNLTANDAIVKGLIKLINIHINCFFKQLKTIGTKTLTVAGINKIIKSNKNLDIFK